MNLLPMLLAGHLLGDWVVQTDWMAANKARSWLAMIDHVATYHVALSACLLLAGGALSTAAYWTLIGISATTHAFLDRRWPVLWLMRRTGSGPFSETAWGPLVVDQALHLSILCLLAAVLS